MAEARLNESCIIGLPTCGYAFSSSRMAFIATPADEEFSLELEVLKDLFLKKNTSPILLCRELTQQNSRFAPRYARR